MSRIEEDEHAGALLVRNRRETLARTPRRSSHEDASTPADDPKGAPERTET